MSFVLTGIEATGDPDPHILPNVAIPVLAQDPEVTPHVAIQVSSIMLWSRALNYDVFHK